MKKLERSETEACVLTLLYVAGFGVACYLHSVLAFLVITAFFATLLACSWRIERLERRIAFYRRELDRQIRSEIETEEVMYETEEPEITVTRGKAV